MACPLGRLYNKEAILRHLLSPAGESAYGHEGTLVAGHLRSLKDVTTLHLTPNPALASLSLAELESSSNAFTQENRSVAAYVCPISLKEMNGATQFVYRVPGGSVLSASSLREMRKANPDLTVDPVTGEQDAPGTAPESWFSINPHEEEAETMREEWEVRQAVEDEAKRLAKERKRKNKGTAVDVGAPPRASKKIKATSPPDEPLPPRAPAILSLSSTISAKIAAEKKHQSAAVLSLYTPKNADPNKDADGRSNWMTRGCYTRYA